MGFRMLSFQPAAFVGNPSRWRHDYRVLSDDTIWAEIEAGAGARLPHRVFQIGDLRCNRTAYGAYVGDRWVPFLDDHEPRDLDVRDDFYAALGGLDFAAPPALLAARLARVLARHPAAVARTAAWLPRFARRAGLAALAHERPRAVTFVMHSFIDADRVRPAWEALQRGERSADPRVRSTQERLEACSYAMAHPESDLLVPACVQHGMLDPAENVRLGELLPLASR
jgi:hypothetical protein